MYVHVYGWAYRCISHVTTDYPTKTIFTIILLSLDSPLRATVLTQTVVLLLALGFIRIPCVDECPWTQKSRLPTWFWEVFPG